MRTKKLFGGMPVIYTDHLVLRAMEDYDFEALYDLYSNDKIYEYRPGVARKTQESVNKLLEKYKEEYEKKEAVYFAVCMKDAPDNVVAVGEIFAIESRLEQVDIGYSVRESCWGKGIATEVVAGLIKYLFEEIEVNRIRAHVMPENIPSHNVVVKNGFLKEGLIRQGALWNGKGIVDVNQYAILKQDYNKGERK